MRLIRCPRGGKVAAQNRGRARDERRDRRLLRRERDVGRSGAAARARAQLRRPRRRVRLRPAPARRRPTARTARARTGATSSASASRVAAALRHRRQRLDLRGASRGLRRRRPAVRPRPLVPVPDGAARPARGLRAGGGRVREADAEHRATSTAARCACSSTAGRSCSRGTCCAGSIPSTSRRSSRTGICATRAGSSTSSPLGANAALLGEGPVYRALFAGQLAFLGLAAASARTAALLRARDLGDGRGARWLSSLRRAGGLGESGGNAVTQTAVELWQELACPRDRSRLEPRGETLVCEHGPRVPVRRRDPRDGRRRRARADPAGLLGEPRADRRASAPPSRRRSRARRSTRTSPS